MTPDEVRACITYANGIDPRVQMTAPNAQLWERVLGQKEAIEVTTATLVYYERQNLTNRDRPPVDPAAIKKIIFEETDRGHAAQAALTAGPKRVASPMSYRQRNPEEWDRLYEEGRRQGNAEREAAARRRGMAA